MPANVVQKTREFAHFIGLPKLLWHFRQMPIRGHLYHLSTALLVGFFALALWILSIQPGDLAGKTTQLAAPATTQEDPIWSSETKIFKDALISPFNYDLIKTFDRALEGDGAAQFRLADSYLSANGLAFNEIEALKWLLIAQSFNSRATGLEKLFLDLRSRLSEGDVKDAQRRMTRWLEIYSSSQ